MMSLAEQIEKLTNPVPKILDPEDDIDVETTAKLCVKVNDNNVIHRSAASLEEIDQKYVGKRCSRKDLGFSEEDESSVSENDENHSNDNDTLEKPDVDDILHQSGDNSASELSDDDASEGIDDDDERTIESFKSQLKNELDTDNRGTCGNDNSESFGNEIELESYRDIDNESDDDDDDDEEEENSGDDMVQKFSNIDVNNEIEKGKAVEAQQELWNRLCECRIKLQKLLVVTNKLPQFSSWNAFKQTPDPSYSENQKKGYKAVKTLLDNLLDLQTELLSADPEMVSLMKDNVDTTIKSPNSDEEIPSDSEEDEKSMVVPEKFIEPEKPCKRKLKDKEYEAFLTKRHKGLIPYRNSVIQRWDEKTRLATGRMTQKSFSAFDQSALKQIEQILQDKNRLIKRTQLKRSIYRILGKMEPEISEKESDELRESMERKAHDLLKDYDPEIFDDDDFYRQLLKDIIDSRSAGIDPAILNKQQEIQRIRSKMKRRVDTKASKGRKIRYDALPKLKNLMAPAITYRISEPEKSGIFATLFGQNSSISIS